MMNESQAVTASINSGITNSTPQAILDITPRQLLPYVLAILIAYPLLVSLLRFRRVQWLHQKYKFPNRASLAKMTDDEAWEIQKVLLQLEFPFLYVKALQFALFRTYGIPTISGLLTKTSQFSNPETSYKRYADTSALVQEFMGNAPSSKRTITAIARTRWLHNGYRTSGKISENDMLYTLGLFALEPIRFIEKYEWRKLTDLEKCAIGTFWKSVGDGLAISYEAFPSHKTGFRDGLQWLEEITAWSEEYEAKYMVPHATNRETADQTTAVLLYMVPKPFQQIGLHFVSFMMDDRLRRAMLYDPPPASYAKLFSSLLSVRRFVIRYLSLPRPYFLRFTAFTEQPDRNDRIFITQWDAAPYYVAPTFRNRWGPVAWLTWAMGRPLPGDEGDKYYPRGYYTPDVGPKYFEGKGRASLEEYVQNLNSSRTGRCPFI
ncbi:hypothetical protein BDV41DRAFT_418081 [Aspergillus transmontanensis]|uniref:ER-bound oxygenase mpaB/mpaB'/Rubber oxygenase catalytic domain-containing protein n=1 Tax=Aspergillus transmontanensis TaxID=1034304 RepID=A0A5N6VMR7_9EURO|nr:hypothetical protein BDV41DRAFT_418081 [Aspergillus transmontanensis]